MKKLLNHKGLTVRVFPTAVGVAMIAASSSGIAQAAEEKTYSLEEVVVTARRTEETLQSVPVAVSSFSNEQIQSLNMKDTSDLAKFTPGLYMEAPAANNATSTTVTIRGQVQSDNIITLDPSVGYYLDDIYLARAYGTVLSLHDAARIEVLKGPQGTLFGRSTTGGAIQLVSEKADTNAGFEGYVTAGIGNYNSWKLGGAVNVPLVEDKFAARIAVLNEKRDQGFGEISYTVPTPGTKESGEKDAKMFRINSTWDASDTTSVQLGYEQFDLYVSQIAYSRTGDSAGAAGFSRSSSDFYEASLNEFPESAAQGSTANIKVEHDLNADHSVKVILGQRDVESSFINEIDGTNVRLNGYVRPFTQEAEQYSAEIQLSGLLLDSQLSYITGLYWFQEEGHDLSHTVSATGAQTVSDGVGENRSVAAYFSGTYDLTSSLSLTAGVRQTQDEKKLDRRVTDPSQPQGSQCKLSTDTPGFNASDCSGSASQEFDFTSYTVSLDWQATDDVLVYLKTASSTRSGGQNLRGFSASTSEPFEEEMATDLEVGVKGEFYDNRVRLNAAAYQTDYKDIQQALIVVDNNDITNFISNRSAANLDGFEIDLLMAPTENIRLTFSGQYFNWNFDDDESLAPAAPEFTYSARFNYNLPTSYGAMDFNLSYSFRGDYLSNASGFDQGTGTAIPARDVARKYSRGVNVDSVELVNARLAFDIDKYDTTLAFWVNNLTKEEYSTSALVLYFENNGMPVGAFSNAPVGEPRTFGIDMTKRF